MKALLVSGIYFPDVGGPATYLPRLSLALINRGFAVSTVSLTDSSLSVRPIEPWGRQFVSRNLNKFQRTYLLIRLIRKEAKNSDIVFINGLFVESAIALTGLKCSTTAKIVGDPVWERLNNQSGTKYSVDEFATQFTGMKNYIQRKIFNLGLSKFDRLTAPSKNLADNIRNWGVKNEVVVIANGVKCRDAWEINPSYDVVSLARLVKWKRINVLIEACAKENLSLAIAGDGPERRNLEELAVKVGCNAHFLGQLDREGSIDLLRKSSIFALISDYEGLSFALVEAMMLEKRILVSNAPGNRAVITNQVEGLVVEEVTARVIADKLRLLKSDRVEIIEMTSLARKKAREFYCEEKQLDEMVELITKNSK